MITPVNIYEGSHNPLNHIYTHNEVSNKGVNVFSDFNNVFNSFNNLMSTETHNNEIKIGFMNIHHLLPKVDQLQAIMYDGTKSFNIFAGQ